MKLLLKRLTALAQAVVLCLIPILGWAQERTVRGVISDASTGYPIPGVVVMIKGTNNGVSTDLDGQYILPLNGQKDPVIVIRSIGYTTQEIPVIDQVDIDVSLATDMVFLDEVVVIGYGSLDKKELTSAVSHISSKEFLATSGADPSMMIQGKVAGVSIENTGAADPNKSASIQIRGISSRSADLGPLIVIDGVPGGNLTNLNPNDIESIDILKDGAASSIYGTRGSNGVVLINTKKGALDGACHTSYEVVTGANFLVNELDMLSAQEFREKKVANGSAEDFGGNVDWLKEISRVGFSHQHTVTLSGARCLYPLKRHISNISSPLLLIK